jgi:hypothetical protein
MTGNQSIIQTNKRIICNLYLFSCSIDMLAVLDVRIPQIPEELSIFGKILEAVQQNLQNYAEFFLVKHHLPLFRAYILF